MRKLLTIFLLPIGLFVLFLLFSGFTSLNYNASFTVLPHEHKNNYHIVSYTEKLLAGKKITGEFMAKENNLGALAIRLHNFNQDNNIAGKKQKEDEIIFRIKEKGVREWYYQQSYSGGQFYELEHFPFGFQPIADSRNKHYYFELISKRGDKNTAITFSSQVPVLITQYQFTKHELLQNKELLVSFLFQKVMYALSHPDFYFILFIFFIPFLFSLFWISFNSFFDLLIFSGFISDILFIQHHNNLVTFMLLSLCLVEIYLGRLTTRAAFSLGLFFLCFSPVLLILHQTGMAEKSAMWTVFLLLFGLIQAIYKFSFNKV